MAFVEGEYFAGLTTTRGRVAYRPCIVKLPQYLAAIPAMVGHEN